MTQAEEVLELIKRKINLGEYDLQIIEEVLSNPFKEYLKREAINWWSHFWKTSKLKGVIWVGLQYFHKKNLKLKKKN